MSALYIETNSHLRKDIEWTWYVDSKTELAIWEDYIFNYGSLILIASYKSKICTKGQRDLTKIGNVHKLKDKNITLKYVDNIYENRLSLLNRSLKEDIKYLMEREISSPEIELVIIEQDNNFYQKQAMKFAQKYKKQYIIERNM